MKPEIQGFSWDKPAVPGLCVLSVVDYYQSKKRKFDKSHKIRWPFWVIDYSFDPGIRCRVGNSSSRWFDRDANVCHLYPPETSYWEDWSHVSYPFRGAYCCFIGGEYAQLGKYVSEQKRFGRFYDPSHRLSRLFQKAAEMGYQLGSNGFWNVQSVLCEIVSILQESKPVDTNGYFIPQVSTSTTISDIIKRTHDYFASNLNRVVSLEETANHLNVSVSSLSHQFKSETGETPIGYHSRLRIQRVKNLLMIGWRLKSIAIEMGYSDIYHLSKAFKRSEGISPTQFLAYQ